MIRRLPKLRRVQLMMAHELLREPTRAELAARLRMPEHAVETLVAYLAGPLELSAAVSGIEAKKRRA
jgi:DNA-directed RNA polymerase sigma subunit (sigma70/sigma32)